MVVTEWDRLLQIWGKHIKLAGVASVILCLVKIWRWFNTYTSWQLHCTFKHVRTYCFSPFSCFQNRWKKSKATRRARANFYSRNGFSPVILTKSTFFVRYVIFGLTVKPLLSGLGRGCMKERLPSRLIVFRDSGKSNPRGILKAKVGEENKTRAE